MPAKNPRVSVTVPKPYMKALDALIRKGVYLSQGEAIRAAIRLLVQSHGVSLTHEELECR